MKRRHYLVFAVVSALGLLSSLALIPRPSQLALLYYKGWRYDAAARIYEARLRGGDLSQNTVMPLAEMYRQRGETDRAVALLERMASKRAGAAAVIAEFYRSAQRPDDYLRTLEHINRMAGSEENLRELCDRYRDAGRYPDLVASLEILTEKYPNNAADFLELANLAASRGQLHEAIGALGRLDKALPNAITGETIQLFTSLLLDEGAARHAFARASSWLTAHHDPGVAASLAEMLESKGQPQLALQLLGPFEQYVDRYPPLVAVWLQALKLNGQQQRANTFLASLELRGRPVGQVPDLPNARRMGRPGTCPTCPGSAAEAPPEPAGPQDDESRRAALEEAAAKSPARKPELVAYWIDKLSTGVQNDDQRVEAVQTLVELGAYDAALPSIADLARRKGGDFFFLYLDTAAKANRHDEAVQFLTVELRRTDLVAEAREERLYALIERGGEAAALPWLREFAERAPGDWGSAYEDAANKLGKRAELISFWQVQAARADVPADRKRDIAYDLLEAGAKEAAEKVFLALSQTAAFGSPEVQELLFLWGPRPKTEGLEWLEARARASQGTEHAKWIEYLNGAVAPSRAAQVAAPPPPAAADSSLESLRSLGMQMYGKASYGPARDYLARYLKVSPGDPETNLAFGEILLRTNDRSGARQYFTRALAQVEKLPPSFETRAQRALLLHRVGRKKEAIAEYKLLVAERPADQNLRADYAELLLEQGSYREAQKIASAR